jgi:PAS domain S-box-containing protein
MNILIVDDNEDTRMILKKILGSNGYAVNDASNGKEALEAAKKSPPDMIISDILMPVMDGFHLCREITADQVLRDIPFVFYTATYTDEKDEELALKCGADRFVRKPAEPAELIKIIQGVIRDASEGNLKVGAVKEESEYDFELYSERLVKKLEKKMLDLEREIAGRREAEEALRASALSWQTTFDAIADPVFVVDAGDKILQCNKATADFLGRPLSEIVGETCWELIHGASERIKGCPVERMRETLRPESLELAADDRILYIATHPVLDQDGKLSKGVHIITDITERRQAEEELLKAKKLESLGVLAGGIAHDFNNMLTVVLGNISLARMLTETFDTEGTVKLLTEVEKAAIRAKDLTARLITFSEGGDPFKEETPMGEFVKDSVTSALSGTGIVWELYMPDDVWPVEIDKSQMKQAIHNIVTNAIEAMPDQGIIRVHCRNIDIGEKDGLTLKQGEYVQVSLKDQGTGIAQESLPKVFDPYFSTKERGTQKGMGLGLAVAYSVVKKHGGAITMESEVGGGTTVHIYIPAVSAEGQAPSAKPEEPSVIKVDSQSTIDNQLADSAKVATTAGSTIQRVLVMDDEEMLRNVSSAMLSKLGYEVAVAADGVEAIEIYKKAKASDQPFDLVILDLTNSSGMGGVEAIRILLQIDPHIRAMVATGYSFNPVVSNFRAYGFCGAITKPFMMGELGRAVQEALKD